MLNICRVVVLLLLASLAACGGGGGSSGAVPNAGAFRTTAGGELTLAVGVSKDFDIQGGVPPYKMGGNSAPAVVTASVNGSILNIRALTAGLASLTILDNKGDSVTVVVTAGSTTPLTSTAPSPLQLANGAALSSFGVFGGRAPYTVTSSDVSIVRASINGSTLLVTPVGIGSTILTIRDSDGLTTSVTVNVGATFPLFLHAPSELKLQTGLSQTYLISGGSIPYQVTSSNPAIASGAVAGTTLTVNSLKVGEAIIKLTDAEGTEKTIEVLAVADASGAVVSAAPQLRNAMLNSSDGSIAASGPTTLSVTLTDPSGKGLPNQLINFKDESTDGKLAFPEGTTALTNSSGIASIKVARSSLTAVGAGSIGITYSYRAGTFNTYPDGSKPPMVDTLVSTFIGYQLSTANVSLSNLKVSGATGSPLTLPAYGTSQVTVQANLNGGPSKTPVQVNFAATCGQISPATASTNSSGIATASYSATDSAGTTVSTQGCGGKTVEISASTTGAPVLTETLNIIGAAATNMSFVDATPTRIYLADSGGLTQSIVRFKLVNARGEVMLGQDVVLTLKTTNGGVPKASFGKPGNIDPVPSTTDSAGIVSIPVFSGTVPTNVLVNAALKSNPKIQTDSASLTIASGRPAQAQVSLSIQKFSLEGWDFDGAESDVTLSLADRQGNPVPDGTAVNFVTSGGVMIPPVCTTGIVPGDSRCTVKIRTQNPRLDVPRVLKKGYVEILAYSAGEEDFVDRNFDNQYVPSDDGAVIGTNFTDLPIAIRDDNRNGRYDAGEFSVPRSGATEISGDRVWGAADVRAQATMVFATSSAVFSDVVATTESVSFVVADGYGNSMPTGSVISVIGTDATNNLAECTVTFGSSTIIPNSLDPIRVTVSLKDCVSGDGVGIEVKTPVTSTISPLSVSIP